MCKYSQIFSVSIRSLFGSVDRREREVINNAGTVNGEGENQKSSNMISILLSIGAVLKGRSCWSLVMVRIERASYVLIWGHWWFHLKDGHFHQLLPYLGLKMGKNT